MTQKLLVELLKRSVLVSCRSLVTKNVLAARLSKQAMKHSSIATEASFKIASDENARCNVKPPVTVFMQTWLL